MNKLQLITGKQSCALKSVLYGPEGIGKSTFASRFPAPVFIDTEGSTNHMDVARTPAPQSWTELLQQVNYFIQHPEELGTLVIDTLDAAERLCMSQFCAMNKLHGIEDMPYGRGYVYIAEDFGKLLNLLDQLRDRGVHIVLTAHAMMRKFEQPDEMGSYDRWELKLGKKTAPLVKEWSDLLLFANYKTSVVNVDGQGAAKGKNKATGGRRVMYATHHPCWDAKNRFGLADELPFDYGQIAHLVKEKAPTVADDAVSIFPDETSGSISYNGELVRENSQTAPAPVEATAQLSAADGGSPAEEASALPPDGIPLSLWTLMRSDGIQPFEVQQAVGSRGVYPADTPIRNYDPGYVSGCLVACWEQVKALILQNREKTPF